MKGKNVQINWNNAGVLISVTTIAVSGILTVGRLDARIGALELAAAQQTPVDLEKRLTRIETRVDYIALQLSKEQPNE